MMTDTELKVKGVHLLANALGLVESERFLAIMQKEPFDYTQWQQSLFADVSIDDLSRKAMEQWNQKHGAS